MLEQLGHDTQAADVAMRLSAQAQIAAMRADCERDGGGRQVMDAVGLCAVHGVLMPPWLAKQFLLMKSRVDEAYVATWDEAFGRPWRKGTRLEIERKKIGDRPRVHAEVWRLVSSNMGRAIDRVLFDEVGESLGMSGPTAERRYSEALRAGHMDVAAWRRGRRSEGS